MVQTTPGTRYEAALYVVVTSKSLYASRVRFRGNSGHEGGSLGKRPSEKTTKGRNALPRRSHSSHSAETCALHP